MTDDIFGKLIKNQMILTMVGEDTTRRRDNFCERENLISIFIYNILLNLNYLQRGTKI